MMLKQILRSASALGAVVAVGAVNASAEICILFLCVGGGGGGGGGGSTPSSVPEIDVSHGLAALAVLLCAGLVLRERFLRARAQNR